MITPSLEQLIWQGKAIFKNYSYAFGQAGGIPVTPGKSCVICGFKWFGCLMINKADPDIDVSPFIHFLRLESGKTVNDYVIKSPVTLVKTAAGNYYNVIGDVNFDCYIVAVDNIQIRIACIPQNKDGVINFTSNVPPEEANEPPNPLGYQADNVIINVGCNTVFQYNPLAERNQSNAAASDRDQFNVNFINEMKPDLDESQDLYGDNGFPIINFQLVYFDTAFLKGLQSSK